jgi:hypothetical protein
VTSSSEATELGASLAARFAREISAGERNLSKILHYVPLHLVHAHPLFERFPVGDFCLETGSYQDPRFANCVEIVL